eukprot:CAMPEP_0168562038 /NCGR_PEP_ID=MMETSP0413-20121227/11911_1 /TAXON_ID=136452 /ORGANISM="Filamoeba nolandi, Strain NC-AS-23-1" /LENGTH=647 /DNA_ID=CAMNT_0008593441 /DNA_START=121 /DNA_END=2064 /DNA_ORIENTATION=-
MSAIAEEINPSYSSLQDHNNNQDNEVRSPKARPAEQILFRDRSRSDADRANEITLSIIVQDYEELKSARTLTLKVNKFVLIKDAIAKIAKKGNVHIIASNYKYGENNFELVQTKSNNVETILAMNQALHSQGIQDKDNLILRKKKRTEIVLIVNINDYKNLHSARQVKGLFWVDLLIGEVIHRVGQKGSVGIPSHEQVHYGLFNENHEFLDNNRTLASLRIHSGETLYLRRLGESETTVTILIEDYLLLQSVRKTSAMFKKETTVFEIVQKVAKKAGIEYSEVENYDLVILNTGVILEHSAQMSEYTVLNGDTLILRKTRKQPKPGSPRLTSIRALKRSSHNNDPSSPSPQISVTALAGTLNFSELQIVEKIGSGSFGKVYKGLYGTTEVAIKVLKELPNDDQMKEFNTEVQMLINARSPYVIKFFGTAQDPNKKVLCIVMEFAHRGSLFHLLNSMNVEITWDRVLGITFDIAKGVQHLHSQNPPILHRDIKTLNFLVTESWEVKIADFGLARLGLAGQMDTLKKLRSTPVYSAPELMEDLEYSTKSDVYSVGMVFWEIVSRCVAGVYKRPFSEYPNIMMEYQVLVQVSKNNLRPTILEGTPPEFAQLIQRCWHSNPHVRPEATEIVCELENIKTDYVNYPTKWESK